MADRGILFSAPMVRALLDGSKTQTRRALRDQSGPDRRCPYGQPGDRLWVRETFFAFGRWETRFNEKLGRDERRFVDMTTACGHAYRYAADNPDLPLTKGRSTAPGWTTRPAIHMPRAASRILLEIAGVRVERLQTITEADALAEGCTRPVGGPDGVPTMRWAYRQLWEAINGAGGWDADPSVWVLCFKRAAPAPE